MDSKFRKYLTLRRSERSSSRSGHAAASLTVDHELDARPRTANSWFGLGRDTPNIFRGSDLAEEPFQSSRYEAAPPGKAPIVVGTPVHGNGPVKLQTNRRLATGELIQTQQDHERTMADILDGQYIVGKKEPRRKSFSSSSSRMARRKISKEDIKHMEYIPPRVPSPVDELPAFRRNSRISASSSDRGRRSRASSQPRRVGDMAPPVPRRSVSLSPSRESMLSAGEEGNLAVEALWKAENTRLATMFNPSESEQQLVLGLQRKSESSMQLEPWAQSESMDNHPADLLPPRALSPYSARNSPTMGISPSLSEAASLWSNDLRTTMRSPGPQSPREDVRIMIENMRSTYLTALETKASHSARSSASRKRASSRSSQAPYQRSPSVNDLNQSVNAPQTRSSGRQSWHAGPADDGAKAPASANQNGLVLRKQRSAQNVSSSSGHWKRQSPPLAPPSAALPPVPQDLEEDSIPEDVLESNPENASSLDRSSEEFAVRPSLARADSLTLGSLLASDSTSQPRSKRRSRHSSYGQKPVPTELSITPDRSREASIRESLPSSISTADYSFSTPDRSSDSIRRPMTTSTIATSVSMTFPPTPNTDPSPSSPTPSQTPTVVPHTYIYDPDDAWDNSFNFDVFFYDSNSTGDSVLRKYKPKKQPRMPSPPSSAAGIGMPTTLSLSGADSSLPSTP